MRLTAEKLTRSFTRVRQGTNILPAVKETSFALPEGSLTEITGRSGSGKSTLLHMLAGLLRPTAGCVLLDDRDLYALDDRTLSALRAKHIGVVPQGQTGLRSLTVMENILLPAMLTGVKGMEPEAEALMERMGIADLRGAKPGELSGGEMRRMSIARAMLLRPEILLADEPTGDLDDENTARVLSLLRQAADAGTAVLLVTHEQEAKRYADRVWRMDAGALVMET